MQCHRSVAVKQRERYLGNHSSTGFFSTIPPFPRLSIPPSSSLSLASRLPHSSFPFATRLTPGLGGRGWAVCEAIWRMLPKAVSTFCPVHQMATWSHLNPLDVLCFASFSCWFSSSAVFFVFSFLVFFFLYSIIRFFLRSWCPCPFYHIIDRGKKLSGQKWDR